MLAGPVEPTHEPILLTPIPKNRSVSTAFPGPTMLSHQPMSQRLSAAKPATWCDAFNAWHTNTALLRSQFTTPYDSHANVKPGKSWPLLNVNGSGKGMNSGCT